MSWIRTISPSAASGKLARLYTRIAGRGGNVDNILTVHSLRPHTLEGHMTLYKSVLHHSENRLPKWFSEALGVFVSRLNGCAYCALHHSAGLKRCLDDEARAETMIASLESGTLENAFTESERAAFHYAEVLVSAPAGMNKQHVDDLRSAGYSDGEILEINQVVSYFCYVNRTANGLGVSTVGDRLGRSPSEGDSWEHH